MLETGSTSYMRPLPGAARMYPETDVLPVTVDNERWERLEIPELLTEKAGRYAKEYGIDAAYAAKLVSSEKIGLFEQSVKEGIKPKLSAFTLLSTIIDLRRDGVDVGSIRDEAYLAVWHAIEDGKAAKEAIPDLLRAIASGKDIAGALASVAPAVSLTELETIVRKILDERADFVAQKGMAALGPLMGVVMGEVRGSVDGKVVSEVLRKEIGARAGKK
jgi:glutamyl-tRNA(Gln) amidotransferase subunit E